MNKTTLQNTASLLIIISLTITILVLGKPVLMPLAISIFLALILLPLCRRLEKAGIPRVPAVIIAELLMGLFFLGILSVFVLQLFQFVNEIPLISGKIMDWYTQLSARITADTLIDKEAIDDYVMENFSSLFQTTGNIITLILGGAMSSLVFLVLVPIYTFMLLSYRRNVSVFLAEERKKENSKANLIAGKITEMIGNYLSGLMLIISIMAVVNSTALYFIGVDYFVFFGCFAAILILVPYIGAIVGSILPIIYCLASQDSFTLPLAVAGYFLVVQMVEGNFITPKIVGNRVNVNPLTVIVAVVLGSLIWGFLGMVLAVPAVAILRIVLNQNEEFKNYSLLLADKVVEGK